MKGKSKRMKGGNAAPINAGVYSGASSNVVKEAHEKGGGFKRGGRVHGKMGHKRMDRKMGHKKARGGAVGGSPFSTAAKLSNLPAEGGTDSHED